MRRLTTRFLVLFDDAGADDAHAPAPQIAWQAVASEQVRRGALEFSWRVRPPCPPRR
jgi:hypothetical protein